MERKFKVLDTPEKSSKFYEKDGPTHKKGRQTKAKGL